MVTETWVDADFPAALLNIPHYYLHRNDRNTCGGGVAVWCKYSSKSINICFDNNISSNAIALHIPEYNIVLFALYHPYWGNISEHSKVIDTIQEYIDHNVSSRDSILLCGDINDLRLNIQHFAVANNLTQVVNFPTRGCNTLDVIYVPISMSHSYVNRVKKLCPLGRSDHSVAFAQPIEAFDIKHKIKIRDFSPRNMGIFAETISSIDWLLLFRHIGDVNSLVEIFEDVLFYVFNIAFPLKNVCISSRDPPWVKPSTKLLMKDKDRAFHNGKYVKYLAIRERLNREISKNKQHYFKNKCTNLSPRDVWKNINSVIKSYNVASVSSHLADTLSSQFSSCFEPEDLHTFVNSTEPINVVFSQTDIIRAIHSTKSNACGPDNIPGFIYRRFSHILSAPLLHIFSTSMSTCVVPNRWKRANIVPIPKGNGEHRPISLISYPAKVLEKLVLSHVLLPKAAPLLNANQFAYIPNKFSGTRNAVTKLIIDTKNKLTSAGGYVHCLAIDFKKAFDKISHNVIIDTSRSQFRFSTPVVSWLCSYLSSRQQRVITKTGYSSPWVNCTSGVPQGSALGPFLFSLVVNDFTPVDNNTITVIYADDLTLAHHVPPDANDNLQCEAVNLENWAAAHKLVLNPDKCKAIAFGAHNNSLPSIRLNGVMLPHCNHIKLLGVTINADLKFHAHCLDVLRKCSVGMAAVRILSRSGFQHSAIWMSYLAFVFSHMSYCFPAICDLPSSILTKYARFEKEACRLANKKFDFKIFTGRLDNQCIKLAKQIARHFDHPLRDLFQSRSATNLELRHRASLLPLNRSHKLLSSFVRFYHYT